MSKPITPSRLRANIYRVLDRVLESGIPVEIERHGRRLLIVPADRESRVANLRPHPEYLRGDPEDLVHLDWSDEWRP
jgi:hypothetical protein